MGFVTRATSGAYGLRGTFWLGTLGNVVGVAGVAAIGLALETAPRLWIALATVAVAVLVVAYALFALVAIWSAAAQYQGPAVSARLAVAVGLAGVICAVVASSLAVTV